MNKKSALIKSSVLVLLLASRTRVVHGRVGGGNNSSAFIVANNNNLFEDITHAETAAKKYPELPSQPSNEEDFLDTNTTMKISGTIFPEGLVNEVVATSNSDTADAVINSFYNDIMLKTMYEDMIIGDAEERDGIDALGLCANVAECSGLQSVLDNASSGATIRLCPRVIDCSSTTLNITKSVNIACAGVHGSCVFSGKTQNKLVQAGSEDSAIDVDIQFKGISFLNGYNDVAVNPTEVNKAFEGGAVALYNQGKNIFRKCLFIGNMVDADITETNDDYSGFGGAIYMEQGEGRIESCIFLNNKAISNERSYAGAVYPRNQSLVLITKSLFKENSAIQAQVGSSAFRGGGALRLNGNTMATVTNCMFGGNYASARGGVANLRLRNEGDTINWKNNVGIPFKLNRAGVSCPGVQVQPNDDPEICKAIKDDFLMVGPADA